MGPKPAVTHYHRIMEHFRVHTCRLRLEPGVRTGSRVHMAHITHPLVGDPGLRWSSTSTERIGKFISTA